jgi:hypothetical protein
VAGIPSGCVVLPHRIRWYRFAQPPANGWDAFGIKNLGSSKNQQHHFPRRTNAFDLKFLIHT